MTAKANTRKRKVFDPVSENDRLVASESSVCFMLSRKKVKYYWSDEDDSDFDL